MSRMLDVYLCDNFVGTLTQDDSGDLELSYDQGYVETKDRGISLSLPSTQKLHKGKSVKALFSGLLPDESEREGLARNLGISKENTFALLEIVGGECAGALALYPQGQKPATEAKDIETLDDAGLKKILDEIKRRPMLAGEDGYRLSLAGAQSKLAVGYKDGRVQLIKGGAPTTHILKPQIEASQVKDSVFNEFFCMKLAKRMGIDVPDAMLHFVDDTPYYLVERYDRVKDAHGNIKRIHQEDFCQALGVAPEMKYEREGGPSITACLDVIAAHMTKPAADQIKLLNMVIFNVLIGNADAHGKNFSLLYKGDKPELAPAYDLLSTAVYKDFAESMAMKIGGEYKPKNVFPHHFHKLTAETKPARSAMDKQIKTMADKIVDTAIDLKTNLKAKGVTAGIFDDIIKVIEARSQQLIIPQQTKTADRK